MPLGFWSVLNYCCFPGCFHHFLLGLPRAVGALDLGVLLEGGGACPLRIATVPLAQLPARCLCSRVRCGPSGRLRYRRLHHSTASVLTPWMFVHFVVRLCIAFLLVLTHGPWFPFKLLWRESPAMFARQPVLAACRVLQTGHGNWMLAADARSGGPSGFQFNQALITKFFEVLLYPFQKECTTCHLTRKATGAPEKLHSPFEHCQAERPCIHRWKNR